MSAPAELPDRIRKLLDGSSPPQRIGRALAFLTTDPDQTPRVSLLSPGEILAIDGHQVRLAVDRRSRTLANAERTGRGTLMIVEPGICCYVGAAARRLPAIIPADEAHPFDSACLALAVEDVRLDQERGALVTGGITYRREMDEDQEVELWRSFWRVLGSADAP